MPWVMVVRVTVVIQLRYEAAKEHCHRVDGRDSQICYGVPNVMRSCLPHPRPDVEAYCTYRSEAKYKDRLYLNI